jgi:hypothetical protein
LKRGIPDIPILLEGTRIPKADQLPDDLKELALRNGLDVRHASFPQDMDRLIRALKDILRSQGIAPTIPSPVDREMPSRNAVDREMPSRNAKVWGFLNDDKNRAVLGWMGGGVAAVVGALWAAFVYFAPPSKPPLPPASVQAGPDGIAVGGNVSGSQLTTGGAVKAPPSSKPSTP